MVVQNSLIKKFISTVIILLLFGYIADAEIVYLKNGKRIDGKIIEKTDKYIKIDFDGIVLTYWTEEIEKIETEPTGQLTYKESTDSNFKRGTDYLKQGKWQQAIDEFKATISVDSEHTGAYFNLGCAYALLGEYEHAIEEFEKAQQFEVAPFDAFCYFNIAGVYVKKAIPNKDAELFKKAADNFKKAAQILPNFILAIDYTMHSTTFSSKEILKNVDAVSFSVSEMGVPPDSVLFLSETKIMGESENRICIFDTMSPPLLYFYRSSSTYYLICTSKLDFQRPTNMSDETMLCYKEILDLFENEDENRFNKLIKWNIFILLSGFYRDKDEFDKAIEFGEKAKSLGLGFSLDYENLAIVYFLKGDRLKANASAKKALEINPKTTSRTFLEEIIRKTE